jgi:putative hydroxymethylpyrimidine transport system ATP-binding protein
MTTAAAPGITLEGSAWTADTRLFGPLSLRLEPARWTSLLGPSGVGKTTLLRLIAGLDTGMKFEGTVKADDGGPLAPRIAWMGQSDLLLPWADVLGNVTLGARLRRNRIDAARARDLIHRVGLSDHAHKRPHQLSGGQRQRAALARTLMEDRALLLLDEPFSALDSRTRVEMQELAGQLLQDRTVLLVTHDPLEATRLSHDAYLMSDGGQGGALAPLALPSIPPVRPIDAPETMQAQAQLFSQLRGAA